MHFLLIYNIQKGFLNKISLVFKFDNKILHFLSLVTEKYQGGDNTPFQVPEGDNEERVILLLLLLFFFCFN